MVDAAGPLDAIVVNVLICHLQRPKDLANRLKVPILEEPRETATVHLNA